MTLAGQLFSNRYEIQREIAKGGMAQVFLARDTLLDRRVALKVLFPEFAREPSFVERFRREAQAAANLNHPNIVSIYDWGQEAGTYFIVMEYVEGRSLRDLIRAEGALEPFAAVDVASEIAAALSFAHRNGVVHRDVKPGNVLLTNTGAVKVTDFGIARAGAGDNLTQTGSVMGTATYFSPEQAQGLPVDGRSDVYSLGVVLYEMVTGEVPFNGDSPVSVAYKHVREDPVPPSRRNPEIAPDLERIILTALAKNADDRYQSADDLRSDLQRFRRGRPLTAAPVTAVMAPVVAAATTVSPAAAAAPTVAQPISPPAAVVVPARRQPNRGLTTALTIAVLLIVVLIVLFVAQAKGKNSDTTSVPDVTGISVSDARQQLTDAGFGVQVIKVASDQPLDQVVSQKPNANTRAKKGSRVVLRVSTGSGEIPVPSVGGMTEADAKQALHDAGLNAGVTQQEASDTVPEGSVIRTDPKEGTRVAKDFPVTLIVSSGAEKIAVPNVLNIDQATAANQLGAAGFRTKVEYASSSDTAAGKVISTDPGPNELAPKGSIVKLVVSTGEADIAIPNVVGLTQDEATTKLENAGFGVKVTTDTTVSAANDGKVVAQSPAPPQTAPKGTLVTITVGKYTPAATTTTTVAGP